MTYTKNAKIIAITTGSTLALLACGGSGGGSGGDNNVEITTSADSVIDSSATNTSGSKITGITTGAGDAITVNYSGTGLQQGTVTGAPSTSTSVAAVNDLAVVDPNTNATVKGYQTYGIIADADTANRNLGVDAFASQDTSDFFGAGNYFDTPTSILSSDIQITGVGYSYAVGYADKNPTISNPTTGTINVTNGGTKFDATLGDIKLDGSINGFNMSGTSALTGTDATGVVEGNIGGNVADATYGVGGVFAGDNNSDTAYSGAFLKVQ